MKEEEKEWHTYMVLLHTYLYVGTFVPGDIVRCPCLKRASTAHQKDKMSVNIREYFYILSIFFTTERQLSRIRLFLGEKPSLP